jgi:hypothetical protein
MGVGNGFELREIVDLEERMAALEVQVNAAKNGRGDDDAYE